MTKQEEIEKAMARELRDLKHKSYDSLQAAQWILGVLATLGVVIKVDNQTLWYLEASEAYKQGQRDLLKAGYVAVEPLIKEE